MNLIGTLVIDDYTVECLRDLLKIGESPRRKMSSFKHLEDIAFSED